MRNTFELSNKNQAWPFDRLFEDFFQPARKLSSTSNVDFVPHCDVEETEKSFSVTC